MPTRAQLSKIEEKQNGHTDLMRAALAGDQDDRCPASLRRGQGAAEDGALGIASHQHPDHAPSLPSPPPRRKIPGALG